jgi:disulfide bond formation protein DsbB
MFENWSLGQALAAMTRGTGDCAIVDTFLGVSLPLWALAGFVAIAAAAIMQWRSGSS